MSDTFEPSESVTDTAVALDFEPPFDPIDTNTDPATEPEGKPVKKTQKQPTRTKVDPDPHELFDLTETGTGADSYVRQKGGPFLSEMPVPTKKQAKKSRPSGKKETKPDAAKPGKTKDKPVSKSEKASDTGLRKMQLRALKVLIANSCEQPVDGLTLDQLAKKAGISPIVMRRGLGPVDPTSRESHDTREGFKSLLSRGMVKCSDDPEKGAVYYLSALGTRTAERVKEHISSVGKVHAKPYSVNAAGTKPKKKKGS